MMNVYVAQDHKHGFSKSLTSFYFVEVGLLVANVSSNVDVLWIQLHIKITQLDNPQ